MALQFSEHLDAELVVFDCMDELSGFRFAPAELVERERQLLARSDVVFTGGRSLYEAKRKHHSNVHLFPSGVDIAQFSRAREPLTQPPDQRSIARPRIGYYGVIDERLDYELIAAAARLRPDYQWIFLGPLAKIDPVSGRWQGGHFDRHCGRPAACSPRGSPASLTGGCFSSTGSGRSSPKALQPPEAAAALGQPRRPAGTR